MGRDCLDNTHFLSFQLKKNEIIKISLVGENTESGPIREFVVGDPAAHLKHSGEAGQALWVSFYTIRRSVSYRKQHAKRPVSVSLKKMRELLC